MDSADHTDPAVRNALSLTKVGRIPVRNLWFLMLYASQLMRLSHEVGLAVEETPADIPDLVARVLCHLVERRLERNLSLGYELRQATLRRLRGRVELLQTERHRLLERGQIACMVEELTVDTPRNRYVRAALAILGPLVRAPDLAHQCRQLAKTLRRMGVHGECPSRAEISTERFGRHDLGDRPMVAAASLAFDLMLPSEDIGNFRLKAPEREVRWIRHLFEKGVAGFYEVELGARGWEVQPNKALDWQVTQQSAGMPSLLPSMRADMVLNHRDSDRRVVIDTKFNEIFTKSQYKDQVIRSAYLYQLYAYLRSQEGIDERAASASGMLLHPAVGENVNEWVLIQNHELCFATVDLASDTQSIRNRLLFLVQRDTQALRSQYPEPSPGGPAG